MTATRTVMLAGPRLDGLEMILNGLLGQADGYILPGEQRPGWEVSPALKVDVPAAPGERLEIEDPDRTPLAALDVDRVRESPDGRRWVAGTLTRLRRPEHGHSRDLRLGGDLDLRGRTVALFAGSIPAGGVIRAIRTADGGEAIDFVFVGGSDASSTASSIRDLEDTAAQLSDSRVFFIPSVDLGVSDDIPVLIVQSLGAASVLDFRRPEQETGGAVVLFTGLSGAGKSTVARALVEHLHAHTPRRAVLLDGDDVRREIAGELGFGAEDRDRNLQRIAWVAARVAEVGGLAVCAPIAPFAASRYAMRAKVEPASPFIVVYVSTPLHIAEARDRKGLYAKARAGLISDFTGIDSPYEEPNDADLVLDTSRFGVEDCVEEVLQLLDRRGIIPHRA